MNDACKNAANPGPDTDAATSFAAWIPDKEERNDMIEVAAYHIAERSGFALSPQNCWAAAEHQIDLMFALKESKKKLQTLVDTALDAVVMIDADGIITDWNPQASRMFGWSREKIMGQPIATTIIPPRYRDSHAHGMNHFLASGEGPFINKMVETAALHREGHEFPVELAIAAVMTEGKPEFSAFIRDITERKRAEAELREMATTDFLTGLANRRHFMARMTGEMARLQRLDNPHAAVLMLDLDHFKHVNDAHGHAAGDAMLKHFAALMRDELRKIDSVGRIGGEEFAIILPGANLDEAGVFAERLRQKVATTPLTLDGQVISITVSIGIAAMRATDANADTALIRADEALYRAKENGRNRVELETDK
ncbi:MAG: diguanylate cyclase [Sulfuritalea sp.]|jgi:diguanylate cyclase (GGDEF)-like protein/PAS domain S-box-containing protein|nr:diguanylate cyclase [Sulfuritalea sp.]